MFIFCSRRITSNGSRCARYVVVGSEAYITVLRFDYDPTTTWVSQVIYVGVGHYGALFLSGS